MRHAVESAGTMPLLRKMLALSCTLQQAKVHPAGAYREGQGQEDGNKSSVSTERRTTGKQVKKLLLALFLLPKKKEQT